jgi:hypothetical protein
MELNYKKYLKYKNKYLIISNKLKGGRNEPNADIIEDPAYNINIINMGGENIISLNDIPRNDIGLYHSRTLQNRLDAWAITQPSAFLIITQSGLNIYCTLFPVRLDEWINIDQTLLFVSLAGMPKIYFDEHSLRRIFGENPDLIINPNFLLYLHHESWTSDNFMRALRIGLELYPSARFNKDFWRNVVSLSATSLQYLPQNLRTDVNFIQELRELNANVDQYLVNN